MNGIDLFVLLFSLVLGVRGFRRGFLSQAIEAVSALSAVIIAGNAYERMGESVSAVAGLPPTVSRGFSFLSIAVIITAIGFFIAALVDGRGADEEKELLGALTGFCFGVIKAMFYSALMLLALSEIPTGWVTNVVDGSAFGRGVIQLFPKLYRYFPR